jgi:L-malate glycosyltransferase
MNAAPVIVDRVQPSHPVKSRTRESASMPTRSQPRLAVRERRTVPAILHPPRPIRVGFVVHVMQVAGAEVLVRETIQRLKSRIDPTIFCLDSIGTIGEQLRDEGTRVVCLGRRPGRDFSVAWRMAAEIRTRRIQVVHAHQYTPFFYAALAKARNLGGFRLILTEHGRHYPDVASPMRRGLNRLALNPLADAVNACCRFSAKALCRTDGFPGRRIDVIENGIDATAYDAASDRRTLRTQLGLSAERRYIACVARFHPVKDHSTLLRAFAQVASVRPDIDLLLAGDGPGRESLQQLVATLGIADRVRFLGVRSDVPDLLLACEAFALTSVSEAASLTLMEAMAAGLPVVVSNVGGNPELVRDGIDGLLFPRGDSSACAAALLRVLEDTDLSRRLGESARKRAVHEFSLNRTVERYHGLYRRLTGRGDHG